MAKQIEFSEKGTREFYQKAGCHSCLDCKHCAAVPSLGGPVCYYVCEVYATLNNISRKNFPYDNTICKEFTPND